MSENKNKRNISLPGNAKISINHYNLPASILGGLTYNSYPVPLLLDGVNELHKNLFDFLTSISDFHERRSLFYEYMQAHFQLSNLSQMGYSEDSSVNRIKINYKRIIFG